MTTPTQAQIEAARNIAIRILLNENTAIVPANREHLINRFTQEIAALTAAAQVGEPQIGILDPKRKAAIDATIERCAQVAKNELEKCQLRGDCDREIEAAALIYDAICKLKD